MLSGRQKVEKLGFNPDEFWQDVIKIDDLLLLNYSKENLTNNVYPYLRELKQKYGFDIPITITGLDVVRLDNKLDNALFEKGLR